MSNNYFQFKQFTVYQDRCAMKVTTDACLFGAWVTDRDKNESITVRHVLDVGTGTGLLSLMYAQKNLSAHIDAIEVDEDACIQAKENVASSPFAKRINVIHGDARSFPFSKKYDRIISNPPFYEREIRSTDERKNVAHHYSGLRIEELLNIISGNLSPSGTFCLLIPFKRNEEIKRILLKQNLFLSKIVFVKQSRGHSYFRVMIAGKLKQKDLSETIIEEISIQDDQQGYTQEFEQLLKDYYLYF